VFLTKFLIYFFTCLTPYGYTEQCTCILLIAVQISVDVIKGGLLVGERGGGEKGQGDSSS